MRVSSTVLLAGMVGAALAAGVVPIGLEPGVGSGLWQGVAQAQSMGQRAVTGRVVDANSASVAGATVFLRDLKTKSIRSFTSDPAGKFRFAQVNMAEDHELWAEKDGKKSAVKTVSTWDSRKEFDCELKLK